MPPSDDDLYGYYLLFAGKGLLFERFLTQVRKLRRRFARRSFVGFLTWFVPRR